MDRDLPVKDDIDEAANGEVSAIEDDGNNDKSVSSRVFGAEDLDNSKKAPVATGPTSPTPNSGGSANNRRDMPKTTDLPHVPKLHSGGRVDRPNSGLTADDSRRLAKYHRVQFHCVELQKVMTVVAQT
jgi:hypothetical protein